MSGGLDSFGRVWDLRTGQCIMFLEGHLKVEGFWLRFIRVILGLVKLFVVAIKSVIFVVIQSVIN